MDLVERPDLCSAMRSYNIWTCTGCNLFEGRWVHVEHYLATTMATTIGLGAALIISQYNPKHSTPSPAIQLRKRPNLIARLSRLSAFDDLISSQWIQQPSPAIFTIAWAIFAFMFLMLYHMHRDDRYQDHVLMIVCANCLVAGLILSGRGFLEVLGTYVPCYIELGFLLSMLLHQSILKAEVVEEISDNIPKNLQDAGVKG